MKKVLMSVLLIMSNISMGLSYQQFIELVKNKNTNIKLNEMNSISALLLSKETELLTSPEFYLKTQWMQDKKDPNPPISIYDRYRSTLAEVGVSQQFENGLQVKLSYTASKNIFETSSFDNKKYWDMSPNIDLVLPMWGEGFGKSVLLQKEISNAQSEVSKYTDDANSRGLLIEAEVIYWQLSLVEDKIKIQEQALNAAKNILKYVSKQKNKNLGEAADVLQANALVEANNLQLQQIQNEKSELLRKITKMLNQDEVLNIENLDKITFENLELYSVPKKMPGERLDLKVKKSLRKVLDSTAQLTEERLRPKLNLVGGYSLQGRSGNTSDALTNSFKNKKDTSYIGLNFSMPLNFGVVNDVNEGARVQKNSAELSLKQAEYEQSQEWNDLYSKIEEAKTNLILSRKLEQMQKIKLEQERIRLHQGRTTTYQVLLFEQDYSQAQLSKILAATQLIGLKAQTNLYAEEK